jgi:hypothetical protein
MKELDVFGLLKLVDMLYLVSTKNDIPLVGVGPGLRALAACIPRLESAADREKSTEQIDYLIEKSKEQESGPGSCDLIINVYGALPCAFPGCATLPGPGGVRPRPKRCSGCRVVIYDSSLCQHAAWRVHRPLCKQIERNQAAAEREAAGE